MVKIILEVYRISTGEVLSEFLEKNSLSPERCCMLDSFKDGKIKIDDILLPILNKFWERNIVYYILQTSDST